MCPLWPMHYLLMYLVAFGLLWFASCQAVGAAVKVAAQYEIVFEPAKVEKLLMEDTANVKVNFVTQNDSREDTNDIVQVLYHSENADIASVLPYRFELDSSKIKSEIRGANFSSSLNITGEFIGRTEICAKGLDARNETVASKCMDVSVTRESRPIDKAFTYSVIVLVAIIYVNMGAALDTDTVKQTMKRPIGPAIGFMSQFVIMPLLSFAVGKALIPDESLQLGLFITGCSPGGGASNIWTLSLGGNLDLSITMTTISTFAAFVMMPLWILYFSKLITTEAHLRIPNSKIATFAISLIAPLAVGILIKRKLPKVAAFLVRILKPFAAFLIVFIIVFAIYTNVYLFRLFNWEIIVAGMLLPWLGYILGALSALLFRQSWKDSLAIGIETGVQNTGLAIFVLRMSLGQPDSDLTTVMPVSVACMTPVLPMALLFGQKIWEKVHSKKSEELGSRTEFALSGSKGSVGSGNIEVIAN